jgi:hypothetical protein
LGVAFAILEKMLPAICTALRQRSYNLIQRNIKSTIYNY